jgi:tRNA threonylcarbamoyladenosine biosynthesis protein TsaE
LVHTYDSGRIILHHADLYRLDRLGEVADLGLHEMVEESGVMLVEWGDMAAETLGAHLEVFISRMPDQDEQRKIVLTANGQTWTPRWERVLSAVAPWQVEM